ncbi:hypothetical protein OG497_38110 [Streptomyces sp. NBC_01242]|uniref:hypothetical protein n=1 Tax=Streptomyces sp. NBC_01242 TaxID=2903795 RepID=UPI00224EB97E|nr:hypothetical protein [Streptomyces sp. NBC_01242]MCX4799675.1 hypothetical protein [Streptomyces sp. NBC_01242]
MPAPDHQTSSGLILPPGLQSAAQPSPDRFDREYGEVGQRSEMAQGDILDSEILQLEAIFAKMQESYGVRAFNVEEFEREAKERVHSQLGLAIDIAWKKVVNAFGIVIEGVASPKVEVVGRVDKKIFDHDKKVFEVTHDVAGLGGPTGVIKSDGALG